MFVWFEKHNKISWTITILIALAIFTISSITFPPSTAPTSQIKPILYHLFAFFFLTLFLTLSAIKKTKTHLIPLVLLISILYGVLDELHQFFVPGRYSSVFDVGINLLGIILAFTIHKIYSNFKYREA